MEDHFFLAGHSQGAATLMKLLENYFADHPEYLNRMIAAYAIGVGFTDNLLATHSYLKFAERPDDTGVIVSCNTEGPGNQYAQVDIERVVVIVTNDESKKYVMPESFNSIFGLESYHAQDYGFFPENLKQNVTA